MFGKNAITRPFHNPSGSLIINEIFYTIQGEGPDIGTPAVFVRLSKCNLRCYFCDTEFESGKLMTEPVVWETVEHVLNSNKDCRLVVITGGEPLLQNFLPLVRRCNGRGIRVSVETAGTIHLDGLEDWFGHRRSNLIVCSPKTPTLARTIIPLIGAFKYVVRAGEIDTATGLPTLSTQIPGNRMSAFMQTESRGVPVYLSPMDEGDPVKNKANLDAAAAACMRHGYRLTFQLHKLVGLP